MTATKSKSATKTKPVVVTTAHRGVFFGYAPDNVDATLPTIRLERCRMCIYWTTDIRGVVGLATAGPSKTCRIGPSASAVVLRDVTAVFDASEDAVAAWEKAPWA